MQTGIYIRAQIAGKWQSIDIGDPNLSATQLLEWLLTLDNTALVKMFQTIKRLKEDKLL